MSDDFRAADLERLFAQTREALESMRMARPQTATGGDDRDGGPAGAAEARTTGEACGGKVRTVVADGRVESVWVDPRLMRLTSEELCEHIVVAVNAGLQAQTATVEAPPLPVDPTVLAEQLRQAQEESVRQMAAFGQAMGAVVARLDRSSQG